MVFPFSIVIFEKMRKSTFRSGRLLSAILLVVYIANPFKLALPYLNYQVNYEYISTVLCENKDKPDMQCEGKCHLNKELKKAAEEESNNKEAILNLFECQEIPSAEFEYSINNLIVLHK